MGLLEGPGAQKGTDYGNHISPDLSPVSCLGVWSPRAYRHWPDGPSSGWE